METHSKAILEYQDTYTHRYSRLVRFIRWKYKIINDADDIVQSAFLKLWNMLLSGKTINNQVALVTKMAKNQSVDFIRKRAREDLTDEFLENATPLESYISLPEHVEITTKVKNIIESDKTGILHAIYLGYTLAEIAIYQDIPLSTVKSRFYRACRKINKLFDST